MSIDWTTTLADQLDWHWQNQLRPRLDGLTDEEYLWEPVPGAWNVRPAGTGSAPIQGGSGEMRIDFAFPEPDPAPVTTIAWRLGHVIVGCLGARAHSHFGATEYDYMTHEYPATAEQALAQLDTAYGQRMGGVRGLDAAGLAAPVGPAEGAWEKEPMAVLVLHINRELIHHGAEIALLRDLYAHRTP